MGEILKGKDSKVSMGGIYLGSCKNVSITLDGGYKTELKGSFKLSVFPLTQTPYMTSIVKDAMKLEEEKVREVWINKTSAVGPTNVFPDMKKLKTFLDKRVEPNLNYPIDKRYMKLREYMEYKNV